MLCYVGLSHYFLKKIPPFFIGLKIFKFEWHENRPKEKLIQVFRFEQLEFFFLFLGIIDELKIIWSLLNFYSTLIYVYCGLLMSDLLFFFPRISSIEGYSFSIWCKMTTELYILSLITSTQVKWLRDKKLIYKKKKEGSNEIKKWTDIRDNWEVNSLWSQMAVEIRGSMGSWWWTWLL